jgi:nicotinamide-nucleotide adenylyltransferase
MKNKIALIVGRFQPFHKGHLFLIEKALKKADKVVIGIGSANILDKDNPIDFETRKKVIKAVFYKERIEKRLLKIVPLPDYFDDRKWLDNLKEQVGKFDLALGNNEWTNNILKKAGYKVLKVDYYKRPLYEGWRIRKLIKEGKKWQDRVPKYIVPWLNDFISKKDIRQFDHVVLGGTFDHFHKGHEALLTKAFEVGKKVTIGIATEEIYKNKFLSETVQPFEVRKNAVEKYTKKGSFIPFSEFTGGTDNMKNINAIVVSRETYPNAMKINELRIKNKLQQLLIIIIEDILAEDGKLISSERIRSGEIDREGKVFSSIFSSTRKTEIKMPESLRPVLQKPLGLVLKDTTALLQLINQLEYPLLIAVGDIIANSLINEKIDPDIKIIDFRSRREDINPKFKISMKDQTKNSNKPGTINIKTAKTINKKINEALRNNSKSWIIVDGEEDLLTLPVILFAPLNSLVLYGHWKHGVIMVNVDENIKDRIKKIIKKFH